MSKNEMIDWTKLNEELNILWDDRYDYLYQYNY